MAAERKELVTSFVLPGPMPTDGAVVSTPFGDAVVERATARGPAYAQPAVRAAPGTSGAARRHDGPPTYAPGPDGVLRLVV